MNSNPPPTEGQPCEELTAEELREINRMCDWISKTGDLAEDARSVQELRSAIARLEEEIRRRTFKPTGYLYVLRAGDYYKIGHTKNPDARLKTLKIQLPFPVEVVYVIPCEDAPAAESWFHWLFSKERVNGEWFLMREEDVRTHIGFMYAGRGGIIYREGDDHPTFVKTGRLEDEE